MARREVIVEVLTPDEVCREVYGAGKQGLLAQLRYEQAGIHEYASAERARRHRIRTPQTVPGPTLQAMLNEKYRRYIKKECK